MDYTIRCPICGGKKLSVFMYGALSPRKVHHCRRCKKIFYIKIEDIEPFICSKCNFPIFTDQYYLMGNNKYKHRYCGRKQVKNGADLS